MSEQFPTLDQSEGPYPPLTGSVASDPTATAHVLPRETVEAPEPVPVRIVDTSVPRTERRRGSLFNVPLILPANLLANQSATVRVLHFRPNRTKATLTVKPRSTAGTAGRVWLSFDESPSPGNGFALDAGDPPMELNTTEDVWAVLDPAAANDAMVCVHEEFPTEVAEHHSNENQIADIHRFRHNRLA